MVLRNSRPASLPTAARVVQALEKTVGNQTQAALLLPITRDMRRYKMKNFNLR